jgi:hypothetical protein
LYGEVYETVTDSNNAVSQAGDRADSSFSLARIKCCLTCIPLCNADHFSLF